MGGAPGAVLVARNFILRAQAEMWRAQSRRKSCPNELSASDFEALEVSGTPRGNQESPKEVCKSPKVTIHRACRVIMSSPGATRDIDPAATPFDPINICRRRGPPKLLSKRRS